LKRASTTTFPPKFISFGASITRVLPANRTEVRREYQPISRRK